MSNTINRRKFIQLTSAGSTLLGLGIMPGCNPTKEQVNASSLQELFGQFQNPPALARPFFRWWWNGNQVTQEELFRELTLMQEAGAGGIEINPVAMPEEAPKIDAEGLTWLDENWALLVQKTAEKAKELGMVTDLIVGTGWPFGGEFLSPEETVQGLKLETQTLKGPGETSIQLPVFDDENHRLEQVMLLPANATDVQAATDLTEQVDALGNLPLSLEDGEYILYTVVWENRFREVMHGAPGGAGPVLDHFNQQAVEKYLQNMSGKITETWGGESQLGDHIRALFCDSIELEGANWTGDFLAEFEQRRGYDLMPYLPFVLMKEDQLPENLRTTLRGVRYGHSLTLAELFEERFIVPYHQWCNAQGCQSRYQAYGHPWLYTNLIDGYLIPDIPEGDQWLFNGGWQPWCDVDQIRYAIWNKYTSSAGHLKGAPIISTEAMTNTRGVFEASLEYIKQATDLNIATGINHLVLHGFNYSPPEAGFPGWVRYGVYFNEQNPWWPYTKLWMHYAGRLSFLFQQGKPVSQIAILGPTADIWSASGLDRNPFNMEPWYLHSLWQAMAHNGYASDYLSERVLEKAQPLENGQFQCMEMQYSTLLVCDAAYISPETAQKIAELAANGVQVVFIGKVPQQAPGLNAQEETNAVKSAIKQAEEAGAATVAAPGTELQKNQQLLTDWAGKMLRDKEVSPGIQISYPDFKLFTNQLTLGKGRLYFFANMDRERRLVFEAAFPEAKNLTPWKWDAETGERWVFPVVEEAETPKLGIHLEPLESLVLIFEEESKGQVLPTEQISREIVEVKGPWEVTLQPAIEGETRTFQMDELSDISQMPGLEGFSGTITYLTTIQIPDQKANRLDLGRVEDIAEVKLGGNSLGTKWWGKKSFALPDKLKPGQYSLEIKVVNRLFNYCRALRENPVAARWTNNRKDAPSLPAGLLGPVRVLEQTSLKG